MTSARILIDRAAKLTLRTPAEITGRNKETPLARTRYAIMLNLRRNGWSTTQIGRALNRDHTTVMNGLWRAGQLQDNPGFKMLCRELETAA